MRHKKYSNQLANLKGYPKALNEKLKRLKGLNSFSIIFYYLRIRNGHTILITDQLFRLQL